MIQIRRIVHMDATSLFVSSLFSLIGAVALVYGWRQRLAVPTLVGLALSVYPYFVAGVVPMTAIGVMLVGALVVGTRMENDA